MRLDEYWERKRIDSGKQFDSKHLLFEYGPIWFRKVLLQGKSFDSRNISEDVKKIKRKYDFIIIDSPPSITYDTLQIVRASNKVFVPAQPSPLDLMATLPFLELAKKERKNPIIILNRVMARAKLTDAMILRLRYAGAKIARSRLSSKVIFAETFSVGRGVIDISVTSDAAKEIINAGNEILRNL